MWHFLALAIVTRYVFAHVFVAPEVRFHSTLVSALQGARSPRQTPMQEYFSNVEGPSRAPHIGTETTKGAAWRGICWQLLAPIPLFSTAPINGIKYSAFTLGVWNLFYNDHN